MRLVFAYLGSAIAWLGAAGFAYGLAWLIGGAIPVNAGWRQPVRGVRIHVEDNGIHTGIVVPVEAAGVRWDDLVRPEHLRDPRYAAHRWRSFGWGDRAFYIDTPTWWDLDPATVARAAIGSEASVMHVDAIAEPIPSPRVRTIVLTPDQYRRLAGFIRAGFAPGAPRHGYAGYDVFYPAHGRYSAVRTCNAWTGAALRAAGVRMGAWTPFPVTVMAWLPPS